ncbi:hypothetical protein ACFLS1_09300 [Verrucomicrobiota bacterium]
MNNINVGRKDGGVGKFFAIGCTTLMVILAVVIFLGYRYVKGALEGFIDQYTDAEPRKLPQLVISENEARAIAEKIDRFKTAVKKGDAVKPLMLTADDINKLINSHSDWKEMEGKAFVTIENDKIKGEISIPLDEMGAILKGRYLNGAAIFTVRLTAGRLFLFIESLEVKGEQVPEEFMKELRSENLAKDINTDKEIAPIIQNLESITTESGQLLIVPKKKP